MPKLWATCSRLPSSAIKAQLPKDPVPYLSPLCGTSLVGGDRPREAMASLSLSRGFCSHLPWATAASTPNPKSPSPLLGLAPTGFHPLWESIMKGGVASVLLAPAGQPAKAGVRLPSCHSDPDCSELFPAALPAAADSRWHAGENCLPQASPGETFTVWGFWGSSWKSKGLPSGLG